MRKGIAFLIIVFCFATTQAEINCKYSGGSNGWAADGASQNLSGAPESCFGDSRNSSTINFSLLVWNPGEISMFIRGDANDSLWATHNSNCGWTGAEYDLYFGGNGSSDSPPCTGSIKNVVINEVRQIPIKSHLWNTSGGTYQMVFSFTSTKGDTLLIRNPENFKWTPAAGYEVKQTSAIKPKSKREAKIIEKLTGYNLLGRSANPSFLSSAASQL